MNKLQPLKAIRKYCLFCMNSSSSEVKMCSDKECPLWQLRFGKGFKGISALKAIRARCYSCGEGTAFDIKNCEITDCCLYYYRFGKNPNLEGKRPNAAQNFKKRELIGKDLPKTGNIEASAGELSPIS